MGCFPCGGESSTDRKQYRKRKINGKDNRCRRDDVHGQMPPGIYHQIQYLTMLILDFLFLSIMGSRK